MEKRWYFTKIFIIVVSQLQEVENISLSTSWSWNKQSEAEYSFASWRRHLRLLVCSGCNELRKRKTQSGFTPRDPWEGSNTARVHTKGPTGSIKHRTGSHQGRHGKRQTQCRFTPRDPWEASNTVRVHTKGPMGSIKHSEGSHHGTRRKKRDSRDGFTVINRAPPDPVHSQEGSIHPFLECSPCHNYLLQAPPGQDLTTSQYCSTEGQSRVEHWNLRKTEHNQTIALAKKNNTAFIFQKWDYEYSRECIRLINQFFWIYDIKISF